MRINEHAHVFTLQSVLSQEAISIMVGRLRRVLLRDFIVEAVEKPCGLYEEFLEDTPRTEGGRWGSAEVAYRVDDIAWLHEVFVRWHGDELPVQLRERHAWRVGVSLFL